MAAQLKNSSAFVHRMHAQFATYFFATMKNITAWEKIGLDKESFTRQENWLLGMSDTRPWVLAGIYILTFLFMVKLAQIIVKRRRGKDIVAVQGGWPFLGQVFTMAAGSPWDIMANWSCQYGGVYSFRLFGNDAVCISDPTILAVVLQTKESKFHKDTGWTYKPFMEILGNGLVTTKGSSWTKQRKLLSSYLRQEILEQIPQMAYDAVERLSLKLDQHVKSGKPIEMAEEFRSLTLGVIAEVLLSLSPEESDQTFAKMYLPIMEESNKRVWNPMRMFMIFLPAWWEHRNHVKSLNDYLTGLINKRWELRIKEAKIAKADNSSITRKPDVLDKVIAPISAAEWEADSVSIIQQLRDEIKTFVLAGHETSASMLAWTLYELHAGTGTGKGGEISTDNINRILSEASIVYSGRMNSKGHVTSMPPRDIIAGDKVSPTSEYHGLDFTECCLRESLRKYSIVPTVVRNVSEDLYVGPYFFEKGTKLMVNIQGAHYNSENWPEPHLYNPHRFSAEQMKVMKPFTFLPFIAGPRNCLGQFLSLLESKCVLSMLLMRYKFVLVNPDTAGKKHDFMVPIIPALGHHFIVTSKE